MAREYDLRDELVTKEILTAVLERTAARVDISQSGLRWFSAQMLSWSFIIAHLKRVSEKGDLEKDLSRAIVDFSRRTVSMTDEELQFVWEICQKHLDFFQLFMGSYTYLSRSQYDLQADPDSKSFEVVEDPRAPREDDNAGDWCYYHYHREGSKCSVELNPPAFVRLNAEEVDTEEHDSDGNEGSEAVESELAAEAATLTNP
jgi:hypothetical protein